MHLDQPQESQCRRNDSMIKDVAHQKHIIPAKIISPNRDSQSNELN